jgi:asparagine synthase (glutamine-hydrolysing)
MARLFGTLGKPLHPDDSRSILSQMGSLGTGEAYRAAVGDRGFVAVSGDAGSAMLHSRDGVTLAICGMARACAAQASPAPVSESMGSALLSDFRKRGVASLLSLSGPFCIALSDERSSTLLLAIDRIGIEQLYFASVDGGIAFATSVDLLARHPDVAPRISLQALFDYMYFHVIPSPITVFEGITRLLPGERVLWAQGTLERSRYWIPRFVENEARPLDALKDEFMATLGAAVHDSVSDGKVGAFLSGGTDSSTIAGLIGRSIGGPAHTYSIGFAAEGYDEMEYARIAARHFGTRHHEYYVTPEDVVAAIPKLAAVCDQPFGNSSAVPAYYCARLAADDGVTRMVGGDGGDELFGGNARYATQQVFALYERLPAELRQRIVEPLARRLPMHVPATRKIRRYVEQAAVPMPERTETYNFLRTIGYEAVFLPDLLRRIDVGQPLALQQDAYFNPTAATLINRQLALDLKFTLADNDLPKVVRACELAGLPVAFPMLDDRVVDFSLRLPPRLKVRGTRLRYFFKEALRGFLPDAIIAKPKHGFGLPFGPWVTRHATLHALAFDSVSDLRRRCIFSETLLDTLPARLNEHPAYYGTMVWILMMLEQWFKFHAPSADGRNL